MRRDDDCPHLRSGGALSRALFAMCASMFGCGGSAGGGQVPDSGTSETTSACEMTERVLPIPFQYEVEDDHLALTTDGGPLALMIGPWGAHAQPHTGHPEGNVKSDWFALWTPDRVAPELVEVAWDTGVVTAGGCHAGARCGVSVAAIDARIPWYRFPDDASRVLRVELLAVHGSDPYDGLAWEVEVELCPYRYVFGHVGEIAPELADAVVAAGGIDPRLDPPIGVNLIEGHPVSASAGLRLARPQIRTGVIAENPLYRTGIDSVPDVPWAQIEWTAINTAESSDGYARSEYSYMDPSLVASLRSILDAQASSPDSFRYAAVPRWLWTAEHVLEATPPFLRQESSGVTSGIGGWFQRPEDEQCDPRPYDTAACAESFSLFPIHTDGTYYDVGSYHSAEVRYLVYRGRAPGDSSNFVAFGEVISPAVPDPTSGVLRIKWRHAYANEYQAVAYRFDPATGRTRFRYGPLLDAASVILPSTIAAPPVPELSDACTNDTLICMTQASYGRF